MIDADKLFVARFYPNQQLTFGMRSIMEMMNLLILLVIFLLVGCDQQSFVGNEVTSSRGDEIRSAGFAQPESQDEDSIGVEPPTEVLTPTLDPEDDMGTDLDNSPEQEPMEVFEPAPDQQIVLGKPVYKEVTSKFSYGDPNPKVDYLFIIDNSKSMERVLSIVQRGFRNILREKNVFSPDSRVAVMNTLIAEWDGSSESYLQVSKNIKEYEDINLEPGFLDLVDKSAYEVFMRSQAPEKVKNNWVLEPCKSKWFLPYATHAENGHYCFEAATQISAEAVQVEAGIKAFEQLLYKHADDQIFRDDAIINIVFVSDTHDPGLHTMNSEYVTTLLNYSELKSKLQLMQPIADLKFHAIAPEPTDMGCSTEQYNGGSYFKLVMASGGEKGDVCHEENYTDLMRKLVVSGTVAQPIFELSESPANLPTVEVDGENFERFELDLNKNTITIPGLDPLKEVEIAVTFKVLDSQDSAN